MLLQTKWKMTRGNSIQRFIFTTQNKSNIVSLRQMELPFILFLFLDKSHWVYSVKSMLGCFALYLGAFSTWAFGHQVYIECLHSFNHIIITIFSFVSRLCHMNFTPSVDILIRIIIRNSCCPLGKYYSYLSQKRSPLLLKPFQWLNCECRINKMNSIPKWTFRFKNLFSILFCVRVFWIKFLKKLKKRKTTITSFKFSTSASNIKMENKINWKICC